MLIDYGCTHEEAAVAVAQRDHLELWDIQQRFAAKVTPADDQVYPKYLRCAQKGMRLVTLRKDPWEAVHFGENVPGKNVQLADQILGRVANAATALRYSAFPSAQSAVEMFHQYPAVFTTSGAWDIRPNPGCYNMAAFPKNPASAKADIRGFGLLAWWTPFGIRSSSIYFATSSKPAQRTRAKTNEKMLLAFRDFDASHIDELVDLKRGIMLHLKEVYGFSNQDLKGTVLCFHEFVGCVPVHLHIRHCVQHDIQTEGNSIALDEVIEHLVKHGGTGQLRLYPRCILYHEGGPHDADHARTWMETNSFCEGVVAPGDDNHRRALCKLALQDGAAWRSVSQFYTHTGTSHSRALGCSCSAEYGAYQ
jgi:hypothetical protein